MRAGRPAARLIRSPRAQEEALDLLLADVGGSEHSPGFKLVRGELSDVQIAMSFSNVFGAPVKVRAPARAGAVRGR